MAALFLGISAAFWAIALRRRRGAIVLVFLTLLFSLALLKFLATDKLQIMW